jgi:DNA-binding response OmpR family regulator
LKPALAKFSAQVRVLIGEDNRDLAQLLVTLFEQHEIKAFHAATWREVIAYF